MMPADDHYTLQHAPIETANLLVINHSHWANMMEIPHFPPLPSTSESPNGTKLFHPWCTSQSSNELETDKKTRFLHTTRGQRRLSKDPVKH